MGGMTKFFYLGVAFLFAWMLVILILVRHYWWNWVTKICLKVCGPLCCVRKKEEDVSEKKESRALSLADCQEKLRTLPEEDEDLAEVVS